MRAISAVLLLALLIAGCSADQTAPSSGAVSVEFFVASDDAVPGLELREVRDEERSIYLEEEPFLTRFHIDRAEIAESDYGDGLRLILSDEGRQELFQATSVNVGRPMAIVVDGAVISVPVIRAALDSREVLVTGSLDRAEIDRIAASINAAR